MLNCIYDCSGRSYIHDCVSYEVTVVTGSAGKSTNGPLPVSQMPESVARRSATYADCLLSALSELWSQSHICDVTLTSDDGTFQTKVHKLVLVAASGYFKSLLLDPDLTVYDHITVPSK